MRLVYYGMLTLAACAGCAKVMPGAVTGAPEAAVYAGLRDSVIRYPSDTVVVIDSTALLPPGAIQSRVGTRVDSMPPTLSAALDRLTESRQSTTSLPFPRPVYLLSKTTLRETFLRGTAGGWNEFHRRYPRQHGYLEVSPIALSTDTLDALVSYAFRCGPLWARASSSGSRAAERAAGRRGGFSGSGSRSRKRPDSRGRIVEFFPQPESPRVEVLATPM